MAQPVPTWRLWAPGSAVFDYPFADWRGPTGGWAIRSWVGVREAVAKRNAATAHNGNIAYFKKRQRTGS